MILKFFVESTASKIFWIWTAIESVAWIVSIIDGSAFVDMLQAVDYVEKSDSSELDRNEEAQVFVIISLAFFVICTITGVVLIHFTEKRRRWALLLLIPFALWSVYYSISYPFDINEMYSKKLDFWAFFFSYFGGGVWFAILFFACHQYFAQSKE